jgi:hypothetical protein
LNGTAGNLLQAIEIRGARAGTVPIVGNQERLLEMILKIFLLAVSAALTLTAQEPVQLKL